MFTDEITRCLRRASCVIWRRERVEYRLKKMGWEVITAEAGSQVMGTGPRYAIMFPVKLSHNKNLKMTDGIHQC